MSITRKILFSTILVSIISLHQHSYAADTLAESPLSPLFKCTLITENTARLECMNREVAILQLAEGQRKLVVIDEASAKALKKESFGFRMPTLPKLALPKLGTDKNVDRLEANIESIYRNDGNRFVKLDNNQTWKIMSGDGKMPKGELTIAIKPAALGSYRATITNGRQKLNKLRVRRVK